MKIAYIGEWHPARGTYFRQRITVTPEEYEEINRRMIENYTKTQDKVREDHIMSEAQLKQMTYERPLDFADRIGNKIYLHLNQLYQIWAAFPNKRFTDNNTILMVKER